MAWNFLIGLVNFLENKKKSRFPTNVLKIYRVEHVIDYVENYFIFFIFQFVVKFSLSCVCRIDKFYARMTDNTFFFTVFVQYDIFYTKK